MQKTRKIAPNLVQSAPMAPQTEQNPTVFIVDDDAAIRFAMQALMDSVNLEHEIFASGDEFLEKITEQINRRIHEITEMQRLGEERFRQEWNTFKADDQKRWANYALTQDEQTKETSRRFERLSERATNFEEQSQDLHDVVQHTNEQLEKLMQGLLTSMRDWLSTTERYTDSTG